MGTVVAVEPPDDPDEWTHEQWCDWLQALEDEPDDDAAPRRRSRFEGSVMGAAMLGLERGMYGRVAKPEVVIEVEADGQDDGLVALDLDDPSKSVFRAGPVPSDPV